MAAAALTYGMNLSTERGVAYYFQHQQRLNSIYTILNLHFCSQQQVVLDGGGVAQLAALAHSMDPTLRLNAVWALKNLLFMADSYTKARVMREVGYATLAALAQDPEDGVQEQALMLVRNLVHGKVRGYTLNRV